MKIFYNFLWIAGLLIWSCCFAMGFNYGHGDSLVVSIILLLSVLAIMSIAIFLLNKWANPLSSINKKTAKTKELACLCVYGLMVILTVSGFAHFIAVQTEVKTAVRPLAMNRITELRRVFGNENKEGSYMAYVQDLSNTYRNAMKANYADESTINLAVSEFEDEMMGEGGYERLKNQANKFLSDCQQSIDFWIPWTVTEYLTQLDVNTESWNNELIRMSEKNDWVKTTGEKYDSHMDSSSSLAELVIHPSSSDFSLLAIVLIIILQVLVLFPYLREKDWSQSGPKKHKSSRFVVYDGNDRSTVKDIDNSIEEI